MAISCTLAEAIKKKLSPLAIGYELFYGMETIPETNTMKHYESINYMITSRTPKMGMMIKWSDISLITIRF